MSRPLRVATYNIHRGVGSDGRADYGRIAAVLEELEADVIALQEVDWERRSAEHRLRDLATRMGADFIPGITLLDQRGFYGNAVLTRLPARSVRRHDISAPQREPRGALDLELALECGGMRVIATHLGLKRGERSTQLQQLLPLLDRGDSAAQLQVLLGDFNEWLRSSRNLRYLQRHLEAPRSPATFPARRPLLALDRLWVRPAVALRSLRVHRSALARVASDHLPLVAELDPACLPVQRRTPGSLRRSS
jgi:endonuclease/exonuclease/phosphatase family metal-dependent hydrolase